MKRSTQQSNPKKNKSKNKSKKKTKQHNNQKKAITKKKKEKKERPMKPVKPDLIRYAINNLLHRKLRSWLMTLSILVGITAIFALVSFGQGLEYYIDHLANEMGKDKISIQAKTIGPPGSGDITFSEDDLSFIESINGVLNAAGMAFENAQVTYKRETKPRYAYLVGTPTGEDGRLTQELMTVDLIQGRTLKRNDQFKAVLGYSYSKEKAVFDRAIQVGDRITVNGYDLKVVGIYDKVGNPQDDKNIYVTFDTYQTLTGSANTPEAYDWIVVQASPTEDPKALAERIEDKFRRRRGLKKGNEDFTVQTLEDLIQTFGSIITGLNGVLIIIALISLFVAGINIMNTMYTAILERTNEIGIMKAIGARNNDILSIFIIEASFLGFSGGALGIILGYAIAKAGEAIASASGYSFLKPIFPLSLIIGCLLFSTLVGAASGFLPARQAAKLQAADALRYE
ncbi:ABC transporter permease [Candidatus Woesearchaeota archaeon]|nr:MAG: ABC transporter permease [Candidatus Woesearchaeota archaeon]